MDDLIRRSPTDDEAFRTTRLAVNAWRGRQIGPDEALARIGDAIYAAQRWGLKMNIARFEKLLSEDPAADKRSTLMDLLSSARSELAGIDSVPSGAFALAPLPVQS